MFWFEKTNLLYRPVMKAFEENIETVPSPLSSPHRDPFDKIVGEFGAEQRSENLTEEYIMELVRDKINNIEIDMEDPATAVDDVIKYLEEKDVEISEDIERYTRFAISEKTNFLRDLKRLGINKDNLKEEERKPLREMALKDAEWIGDVVEYIRENRDNPKEIEKFWKEYDKNFLSFKEHKKNKNFTTKYNIEEGPEVTKRGILAEIAAMDLAEEIMNSFKMCEKVEIKYSTPEQDVYDKVDFFLVVTLKNGKVIEIPVQVTSCDLSKPINNPLDQKNKTGLEIKREREELNRKTKFVLSNAIHTIITAEEMEIDSSYPYQKILENKIAKFFKINKDGVLIVVPFGKVKDKEFDPAGGEETRKECVRKNGEPSRIVKNHFEKNPTIKNIERDLAQIAQ